MSVICKYCSHSHINDHKLIPHADHCPIQELVNTREALTDARQTLNEKINELTALKEQLAQANLELENWRNWDAKSHLKDLREQAMDRNGEYKNSLCASSLYIGALEHHIKRLEAFLLDIRTHARTVNNGLSYDPTKLIDKPELDKLLEGNDE